MGCPKLSYQPQMRVLRGRETEPSRKENIAQWWQLTDPLAEWRYSTSPYSYASNNPINRIDPDGRFDTKFGAWLYKLFNGGDAILKDAATSQYFVSQKIKDSKVADAEVTRVFDWGSNNSSGMEGWGGSQPSGDYYYSGRGGASPVKQQATKGVDKYTDVTLLLPMLGGASAFGGPGAPRAQLGPLKMAEAAEGARSAASDLKDLKNADAKAKESTGDKTDASGRPTERTSDYSDTYLNRDGTISVITDTSTHRINPATGDTILELKSSGKDYAKFNTGRYPKNK